MGVRDKNPPDVGIWLAGTASEADVEGICNELADMQPSKIRISHGSSIVESEP